MQSIYTLFLLFFYSIFLSSCDNNHLVIEADLQHHRFLPISLNEKNLIYSNNQKTHPIFIEFGEHSTINGQICNYFTGTIILAKNKLNTTYLSSTVQQCNDPQLIILDSIVTQLLQTGAIINFNKDTSKLTLKNSQYQLVLQLNDLM